jgi:hypothetical protein
MVDHHSYHSIHLLSSLFHSINQSVQYRYNLPRGDFPDVNKFKKSLQELSDIREQFPKLDKSLVREMDRVLSEDVARLLEQCSVKVKAQPSPPSSPPSSSQPQQYQEVVYSGGVESKSAFFPSYDQQDYPQNYDKHYHQQPHEQQNRDADSWQPSYQNFTPKKR